MAQNVVKRVVSGRGAAAAVGRRMQRSVPRRQGWPGQIAQVLRYAGSMQLYNYFRSSASFRVRMALALKNLPYDYHAVHLVHGEQRAPAYTQQVGDSLVPALDLGDGSAWLQQSMAIMEYLDETHPTPSLLPGDALARARIRSLAQLVACDIHPLNNLRVLRWLVQEGGLAEDTKNLWYHHWVRHGLEAFEHTLELLATERQRLGLPPSTFCWGDTPTLADCCLVPQIFNAQRFAVPLQGLPRTVAAYEAAWALPAVQAAQPAACPDAPA